VTASGQLRALRVAVTDRERASALYRGLLGAVPSPDGPSSWAWPPGVAIELSEQSPPGVTGVVLAVDDPAAVAMRLADFHLSVAPADVPDTYDVDARPVLGGRVRLVPAAAPIEVVTDGGAAGVTAFDHVCFGVLDLARASDLLQATGAVPVFGGDSPLGVRSLHLKYAVGKIELLTPLRDDSDLGRHLARRGGPAPHHITILVRNVPTAVAAAEAAGFPTTWTNLDHPSWLETYLRPAGADGMLIQLAHTELAYDDVLDAQTYRDVFDGRYWVAFNVMRPTAEVDS
jgi:catechol 2,3-dioxygenase-like lactoylglutathione lyase family enzyme